MENNIKTKQQEFSPTFSSITIPQNNDPGSRNDNSTRERDEKWVGSSHANETINHRSIGDLRDVFGENAAFIPVKRGAKCPLNKKWQDTKPDDFDDSAFDGNNIGIVTGANSCGLISIDCDSDKGFDELLSLNPIFKNTTQTRAARGGNFWIKLKDDEIPDLTKLGDFGEFRSTGGQTVVSGVHPKGCHYEIINQSLPIEIYISQINWPEHVNVPWEKSTFDMLVDQFGGPFVVNKNSISFNEIFFSHLFADENLVSWSSSEKSFYTYDPSNGIWKMVSEEFISNQIRRMLLRVIDTQGKAYQDAKKKIKSHLINGMLETLKGIIENLFVMEPNSKLMNTKNGVLKLGKRKLERIPFSHKHNLVNPGFFNYPPIESNSTLPPRINEVPLISIHNLKTKADSFRRKWLERNYSRLPSSIILKESYQFFPKESQYIRFLSGALAPEDINMLQKYLGSLIFGGNPCQNLLIIKGVPGSGKSVLLDLIIGLVGVNNCVELRTEHLNQRFETARFIGKKLLFGPDVEADFLQRKESNTIKSLVGHDLLSAELKHGRGSASLIGNFGVVITSNHTLKLNTKDDLEAWRRRLLVIDFPNTFTGRKIPNFSNKLLHEEGDAIFAWAVYGRMLLEKDIQKYGSIFLTKNQHLKVSQIVDYSNSLSFFLESEISKDTRNRLSNVTTIEICEAYENFCHERGVQILPKNVLEKRLPSLMKQMFGVVKVNSIPGPHGRCARGYNGVRLKNSI